MTPQQRLAQAFAVVVRSSVALNQALGQRQAAIDVGAVLLPERLASLEGIASSLETLAALEAFGDECGVIWQQWTVEACRQFTAALDDFPENEREEALRGMMTSLQAQMALQARLQAMTADFIDAARIICKLAQRGRECAPKAKLMVFANAADRAEYNRQLARVAAAADEEARIVEERRARVQQGLQRLQT